MWEQTVGVGKWWRNNTGVGACTLELYLSSTAPPGPGEINSLSNVHSKCVNSHQGAAQKAKDVDVLVMMLLFAKPVSGYVRPKALN